VLYGGTTDPEADRRRGGKKGVDSVRKKYAGDSSSRGSLNFMVG